jgi:hypothetical protein
MRYFIGYHNEEKTKMPCTRLPYPRLRTKRPVAGTEGGVVWVVAGMGSSPKRYVLTSQFTIEKCEENKYPAEDLPNEVSGTGRLFGASISLDRTTLLDTLRRVSANFISGFREIDDPSLIAQLKALT